MSALERWLSGALVLAGLLVLAALGAHRYGAEQFAAGQAAAVAAGEKLRQAEADRNRATETTLRAQLATQDAAAFTKEKEYASNLEAAQRRVRAGVDGLRCPTASPVPAGAPAGDRPTTAGIEVVAGGSQLMPEAAADLLGVAGDVAGLVRRYERLEQRFDACRAVNAGP